MPMELISPEVGFRINFQSMPMATKDIMTGRKKVAVKKVTPLNFSRRNSAMIKAKTVLPSTDQNPKTKL